MVTWGPYNSDIKYSNWPWRIPSLLQGVLPLLQLVLAVLGPESPRWLISKGKMARVLDFFVQYRGDCDKSLRLVQLQIAGILATLEEKSQNQAQWA
jgi:hypothetical protein